MKELIDVLKGMFLAFISWWGFIAMAIIYLFKLIPDKWYFTIPCFILAILWAVVTRSLIEKRKNKF